MLDVTLPSGLLAFACDDCGAGRTLDEHASETQCHVCRKVKYFRICPRCEARVFCPGLTEKQQKKVFFHWTCPNCLADIRPARWLLGKAADFIGSLGEDHYLTSYRLLGLSATEGNADPDRRKLTGTLLAASGFSGIATGSCTILFCSTGAALMIGNTENCIAIPYSDMTALRVSGRGSFTTSSGGGWMGGGFGLTGALEGALMAGVLNALTTRTKTGTETIISFGWEANEIVLLTEIRQ